MTAIRSVIIPKENQLIYGFNDDCCFFIRPEVYEWLKEFAPNYFRAGSVYKPMSRRFDMEDYIGEKWSFETKQQAMLFKLTWGG